MCQYLEPGSIPATSRRSIWRGFLFMSSGHHCISLESRQKLKFFAKVVYDIIVLSFFDTLYPVFNSFYY